MMQLLHQPDNTDIYTQLEHIALFPGCYERNGVLLTLITLAIYFDLC